MMVSSLSSASFLLMVQANGRVDGAARWSSKPSDTRHKSDNNVATENTTPKEQVPRHKGVNDWKYDKVRVRRPRRAAEWAAQSLPMNDRGLAPCSVPALDVPVATAPVDEYVTSAPTTEFVTPLAAILAATAAPVTALSDLLEPPAPVEFANYEGTIEELSKAMEETLSAVKDEYIEYFDKPTPATLADYISWLDTGPAPDKGKYFISMTRSQEVHYAARTIQWGWRWMHKKVELRAVSEERLQKKLREVRRRCVERLPVGANARMMEGLKDIQSNLKDAEEEWIMLFNEELEKLETESRCRSRMIAWCAVMKEAIGKLVHS